MRSQIRDQLAPDPLFIGWTGTHTTLRHLDLVWPVLRRPEAEGHAFESGVITDQPLHEPDLRSFCFVPRQKAAETPDLLTFRIGLMADGHNGFVCASKAEWYIALRRLLAEPGLRAELEGAARCTIVERYSMTSNTANFLSLFEAGQPPRV